MTTVKKCQELNKVKETSGTILTTAIKPKTIHGTDTIALIEREINNANSMPGLDNRQHFETEIISILTQCIHKFEPTLKVHPIGSTRYGIRLLNTNVNLLITTSEYVELFIWAFLIIVLWYFSDGKKAKEVSQRFYSNLHKTGIFLHFKNFNKISADRVMKRQISMVHIKSGLQCLLMFAKEPIISKSTEIISRYTKDPLCKRFSVLFVFNIALSY